VVLTCCVDELVTTPAFARVVTPAVLLDEDDVLTIPAWEVAEVCTSVPLVCGEVEDKAALTCCEDELVMAPALTTPVTAALLCEDDGLEVAEICAVIETT